MDTSIALRIDGSLQQWGGKNSPQGDKQKRRLQKLQALLQSLKAGELEDARIGFGLKYPTNRGGLEAFVEAISKQEWGSKTTKLETLVV